MEHNVAYVASAPTSGQGADAAVTHTAGVEKGIESGRDVCLATYPLQLLVLLLQLRLHLAQLLLNVAVSLLSLSARTVYKFN